MYILYTSVSIELLSIARTGANETRKFLATHWVTIRYCELYYENILAYQHNICFKFQSKRLGLLTSLPNKCIYHTIKVNYFDFYPVTFHVVRIDDVSWKCCSLSVSECQCASLRLRTVLGYTTVIQQWTHPDRWNAALLVITIGPHSSCLNTCISWVWRYKFFTTLWSVKNILEDFTDVSNKL